MALGVDSASNRNEYQEYFLGRKDGLYVGLITLPPSCGDCLSRPMQGFLYLLPHIKLMGINNNHRLKSDKLAGLAWFGP